MMRWRCKVEMSAYQNKVQTTLQYNSDKKSSTQRFQAPSPIQSWWHENMHKKLLVKGKSKSTRKKNNKTKTQIKVWETPIWKRTSIELMKWQVHHVHEKKWNKKKQFKLKLFEIWGTLERGLYWGLYFVKLWLYFCSYEDNHYHIS